MRKKSAIFCLLWIAVAAIGAVAQDSAARRTVLDGVYTPAQVERGRAAYEEHCGNCHKPDLMGEGEMVPLRGGNFMERWREYSLTPLFQLIKTEMPPLRFRTPETRPLEDSTYVDVLSYMLQVNGFPAGTRELTVNALDSVQMVRQGGAQPPPNHALVRSAGCLTLSPESRWLLTDATEPVRATMPDIATPEELAASRSLPPGVREYRLADFTYIGDNFDPEALEAQRIQVKGYLIRQPEFERISVTSIEALGSACR